MSTENLKLPEENEAAETAEMPAEKEEVRPRKSLEFRPFDDLLLKPGLEWTDAEKLAVKEYVFTGTNHEMLLYFAARIERDSRQECVQGYADGRYDGVIDRYDPGYQRVETEDESLHQKPAKTANLAAFLRTDFNFHVRDFLKKQLRIRTHEIHLAAGSSEFDLGTHLMAEETVERLSSEEVAECCNQIERILKRLNPETAEIFRHLSKGWTHQQVADELGCSTKHVGRQWKKIKEDRMVQELGREIYMR